jgi:hypothetical protein
MLANVELDPLPWPPPAPPTVTAYSIPLVMLCGDSADLLPPLVAVEVLYPPPPPPPPGLLAFPLPPPPPATTKSIPIVYGVSVVNDAEGTDAGPFPLALFPLTVTVCSVDEAKPISDIGLDEAVTDAPFAPTAVKEVAVLPFALGVKLTVQPVAKTSEIVTLVGGVGVATLETPET